MIQAVSSITLADGISALAGLRSIGRAAPAGQAAQVQPVTVVVSGSGGTCSDGDCGGDTAQISDQARSLADQAAGGSTAIRSAAALAAGQPGQLLDVTA